MSVNKISNEVLVSVLSFISPTECLQIRSSSKRLNIIVALRFRREILLRATENEEITNKLKYLGIWEDLELHPLHQAKILLDINNDFLMLSRMISSGDLSIYAAPTLVVRLTACLFSIIHGKIQDYYSGGTYNLANIQQAISRFNPKESISNLTDSVLVNVKEMMNFKPWEVDSIKSMGELPRKLLAVCEKAIEWHDKEYKAHNLKAQHGYFKIELNKERIMWLSKIFIKALKKYIPSQMF